MPFQTGGPARRQARPTWYFCAVALRRAAFLNVGGFDEGFDWLDADLDMSLRLHEAGWQLQTDPSLKACHRGGGSFQTTAQRVFRFHRNRWRLLTKHRRIRHPALLKLGLAARHGLEFAWLHTVGRLLIRDPRLAPRFGKTS